MTADGRPIRKLFQGRSTCTSIMTAAIVDEASNTSKARARASLTALWRDSFTRCLENIVSSRVIPCRIHIVTRGVLSYLGYPGKD